MTCLTLLILAIFLFRSPPGPVQVLLAALIAAIVLMQGIFLLHGEQQVRGWDTTEYRELLITMGFLAIAAEVRMRQLRGRGR